MVRYATVRYGTRRRTRNQATDTNGGLFIINSDPRPSICLDNLQLGLRFLAYSYYGTGMSNLDDIHLKDPRLPLAEEFQ